MTESTHKPPDPPHLKVLRAIVIGMGVLLVLGFLGLIAALVLRPGSGGEEAAPAAGPAVEQDAPSGAAASRDDRARTRIAPLVEGGIVLPAGAEIVHMAISADRLALHLRQPGGGESILLVDAHTGAVVGRLAIDRHDE
jgi:hypothetical protein